MVDAGIEGEVYLEFVHLPLFDRTRKGVFDDEELKDLEDALLKNPEDGVVMRATGGVRKSRVANRGHGKRGSGRAAYLYVPGHQTVYFILAFAKNVQSNLSAEQKRLVRALAKDIEKEPWPRKHAGSHRS